MRSTARERYLQVLTRARIDLKKLHRRLGQAADLVTAKRELIQWQKETEAALTPFESDDAITFFRDQVDLQELPLDGTSVINAIEAYSTMLADISANARTADLTRGYDPQVEPALARIDELIQHLADVIKRSSNQSDSRQTAEDALRRWKHRAHEEIRAILGDDEASAFYQKKAGDSWGNGTDDQQFEMYARYLMDLKEEIQKRPEIVKTHESSSAAASQSQSSFNNHVFVVHGHSDLKHAVARVVSGFDLKPVLLEERAGSGLTLIEKVEKYSDVGYAIVIATPDDSGAKVGDAQAARARQNVVFELGYFVGKLGRGRTCLLYDPVVNLPSDYTGVEYVELDRFSGWKLKVARELKAAGYDVDLNKLA